MEHPERMIEVSWDDGADALFQVEIVVECLDRMGLLKDVTIAIGDAGANILSAATSTDREGVPALFGRDLRCQRLGRAACRH